jgi:hypothetical protein
VTDNTLWYDKIINKVIQENESSKLATPQQEKSETSSETSSDESKT